MHFTKVYTFRLQFADNMHTRQLPMGAGHCQWDGFTDRNLCNIHGEEHLASRCRAMLRNGPATLATCQYWETFLEEAPCRSTTFGNLPKLVGMLPIVPYLTLHGLEMTYT